jgi:MerR family transcriptional regulator/heat shock protein HspR
MPSTQRLYKVVHVIAELQVDMDLVRQLAEAELIHLEHDSSGEPLISSIDAERIRLVQLLMADLGVNMAGAEVILHMRETMLSMQQQMRDILDAVAQELRERKGR